MGQIETENQISEYFKRLEKIKRSSIMKLNQDQQKSIYIALKNEKEEKRKKLEEDLKAKNQ